MGETGEDGLQLHARDVVPFAPRGEEDRGFARTSGSCATGNLAW